MAKKTKDHSLVIIALLLVLGLFILATLHYFRTQISQQQNSEADTSLDKTYQFKWNNFTHLAQIVKDGKELQSFEFKEKPFHVWYEPEKNFSFVVTTEDQTEKGAHIGYIYNGSELKQVFHGNVTVFPDNTVSPGHVGSIQESPDGKILYISESGYEGGDSTAIDLQSLRQLPIENQLNAFGDIYWSPNGECAFNAISMYGDSNYLVLTKKMDTGYIMQEQNGYESYPQVEHLEVFWKDNCSGVLNITAVDVDDPSPQSQPTEMWLSFQYDKALTKLSKAPDVSKYQKSLPNKSWSKIY